MNIRSLFARQTTRYVSDHPAHVILSPVSSWEENVFALSWAFRRKQFAPCCSFPYFFPYSLPLKTFALGCSFYQSSLLTLFIPTSIQSATYFILACSWIEPLNCTVLWSRLFPQHFLTYWVICLMPSEMQAFITSTTRFWAFSPQPESRTLTAISRTVNKEIILFLVFQTFILFLCEIYSYFCIYNHYTIDFL